MRRMSEYFTGGLLLALLVFRMATANAMQIPQYDTMGAKDEGRYVALLLKGAHQGLEAHGQTKQDKQLLALFTDNSPQGGAAQFEQNLQVARLLNSKNAADPNNKQPPYEVENAMAVTLKDNGITVPASFLLTIKNDFKPASSPSKP